MVSAKPISRLSRCPLTDARSAFIVTRFTRIDTPIAGLALLQRHPMADERGYLERLLCREELAMFLGQRPIVQINHTYTARAGPCAACISRIRRTLR